MIDAPRQGGSTVRIDAVAEWRSRLSGLTMALLVFEVASGLLVYALPFGEGVQAFLLAHTLTGAIMLVPTIWYVLRHWLTRRRGNLSHIQLLGYLAVAALAVCLLSGVVVTVQSAFGTRMSPAWRQVHLLSGMIFPLLLGAHLATVVLRRVNNPTAAAALRAARWLFTARTLWICGLLAAVSSAWALIRGREPDAFRPFPPDYSWTFGADRPFAPSLARVAYDGAPGGVPERGALDEAALAGSASCGRSGCHEQIYREWLPSAHRYSALDDMFQRVQALMAAETSPEHTRYCAGCHDPISLFSGAKDASNITLSAHGANEGTSCLVCHSIVQSDVQGNADYTIAPPRPYAYERQVGMLAEFVSGFLIRAHPDHHVRSYARPLYKTAEFCGACHKQYVDVEVNTDIGKVQGQNQYDSWKNSRWHHAGDPQRTLTCRECHMPLVASADPARGDRVDPNRAPSDGRHRSHRLLAANQYIPLRHGLEGAAEHVSLIEAWLRGEIDIPEIADRWTDGPVVRLELDAPARTRPGSGFDVQVTLTNNKTGHDFPTGPLDMIESWVELLVSGPSGEVLHHSGGLDDRERVTRPPVWFKADGFDRRGELIDRHNLWDLVGASYKRTLYAGMTDTVQMTLQCPSMARGRVNGAVPEPAAGTRVERYAVPGAGQAGEALTVRARLWYRKANPEFLDRVYGVDASIRSPVTLMTEATRIVHVTEERP
jgi:hypothetical protein